MDSKKLVMQFGRLKGIRDVVSLQDFTLKSVGDDYNNIVDNISGILDEDLSSFKLTGQFFYPAGNFEHCYSYVISGKLFQLSQFQNVLVNTTQYAKIDLNMPRQ